jgi:hypothetical protein
MGAAPASSSRLRDESRGRIRREKRGKETRSRSQLEKVWEPLRVFQFHAGIAAPVSQPPIKDFKNGWDETLQGGNYSKHPATSYRHRAFGSDAELVFE